VSIFHNHEVVRHSWNLNCTSTNIYENFTEGVNSLVSEMKTQNKHQSLKQNNILWFCFFSQHYFLCSNGFLSRNWLGCLLTSLLAGRYQAEAGRNGLRPLLVKSRFMRTERTQNSHWSEVPHELISCKYLTRTTFRNVILKLAFNQWHIKP
jgi:hypothetical protein